ncbi:hypothetical protein GCM10027404_33570 [Arthrobacter tumbae]
MRIVPKPYHPDVTVLVEGLRAECLQIYGSRDDSPIGAAQFSSPCGDFAVGYDGDFPIAIDGWRLRDDGRAELKRMYIVDAHEGNGHPRSILQWSGSLGR